MQVRETPLPATREPAKDAEDLQRLRKENERLQQKLVNAERESAIKSQLIESYVSAVNDVNIHSSTMVTEMMQRLNKASCEEVCEELRVSGLPNSLSIVGRARRLGRDEPSFALAFDFWTSVRCGNPSSLGVQAFFKPGTITIDLLPWVQSLERSCGSSSIGCRDDTRPG